MRFTIRWMMVAVAVIAVVNAVLIHFYPGEDWVGHASIRLEFVILDAPTGQPLEGASIRLVEVAPEYEAITEADGRAKIVIDATVCGQSSLVRNTRVVNYAWTLLVTCNGHRRVNQDLSEVTRGPRYHSDVAPPPIVIRLAPCQRGCNR
jgi:hypothetical protein